MFAWLTNNGWHTARQEAAKLPTSSPPSIPPPLPPPPPPPPPHGGPYTPPSPRAPVRPGSRLFPPPPPPSVSDTAWPVHTSCLCGPGMPRIQTSALLPNAAQQGALAPPHPHGSVLVVFTAQLAGCLGGCVCFNVALCLHAGDITASVWSDNTCSLSVSSGTLNLTATGLVLAT